MNVHALLVFGPLPNRHVTTAPESDKTENDIRHAMVVNGIKGKILTVVL